jgi:prevent-host-death family protein
MQEAGIVQVAMQERTRTCTKAQGLEGGGPRPKRWSSDPPELLRRRNVAMENSRREARGEVNPCGTQRHRPRSARKGGHRRGTGGGTRARRTPRRGRCEHLNRDPDIRPGPSHPRERSTRRSLAASFLGMRNVAAPPISTAELSEKAAELVKRVHETGDAVIVTQDGEPAAVLVDATEFAALREHRRFLEAINEGMADVDAGRVLTTQELKKSFEAEFGPIAWQ